jgi:predicted ferric reductase
MITDFATQIKKKAKTYIQKSITRWSNWIFAINNTVDRNYAKLHYSLFYLPLILLVIIVLVLHYYGVSSIVTPNFSTSS